jgi:glycosyltransferase involved in cell wall biosynthesis
MIKRSLDVVKTFSRNFSNSNFELHLYGTFREDIDLYISSNQLQNSVFQHGMVHQEELSKMMNEAISLVQFSSVETFGCIVAEALCCGLPVIVSDIPAMKELVTENVNGILVEKDDVNCWVCKNKIFLRICWENH